MGNSASSSGRIAQDDTVDFGFLYPQGVYSGPREWNEAIVGQLICERKLAPFYRPLEDYDPSWDDEQILAARKEPPPPDSGQSESLTRSDTVSSKLGHHKRPSTAKEVPRSVEAAIYRNAAECPICFLYYPANINHSRCCDQAICTECFVQIKRSEPTVTRLVSDPACCPYCVQEHFGVVYTPPSWRAGIGSEGSPQSSWPDSPKESEASLQSATANPGKQKRRKSFGHDSAEVVATDQIRPDWETKLAAVRAAAARRANRRIIMRQVGDRLIPVGVSSGRVHALPTEMGEGGGSGRRSRRRGQNPELNQLLGHMSLGGQDLEELMVMEAMRLSLLEHEEQQRREAAEQAANGGEGDSNQHPSDESSAPASEAPASSGTLSANTTSSPSSTSVSPSVEPRSPVPPSPSTAAPTSNGTAVAHQSPSVPPSPSSHTSETAVNASNTGGSNSDTDWRRREHLPPLPRLEPLIPDNIRMASPKASVGAYRGGQRRVGRGLMAPMLAQTGVLMVSRARQFILHRMEVSRKDKRRFNHADSLRFEAAGCMDWRPGMVECPWTDSVGQPICRRCGGTLGIPYIQCLAVHALFLVSDEICI
ncbi:hypothetical protein EW146_g6426 [Bondarzewia mesenterica]|uniref:RING-type domain-containing protein n=1 Tax=Bondarzewia mesenterica TaxID=1095465 RepID=A0A4S4LNK9_9AGAM|nr:hypothetical protein EW146_g6426 [Bondarzewia mesenterica]